tara:strand:+ start:175 stop:390 length:216 start_codon:yes stop_codon:yes gene_type:complete
MNENVLLDLTPAEINIVRQSLRAEHDRMVKQGFSQLAKLATETSSKISDAVIDSNRPKVYNKNTKSQRATE